MGKIPFDDFVKGLDLEVVYEGDHRDLEFMTSDVNRPGLQLAGYFDYFCETALRLQVIGKIEMYYINTLDEKLRRERLDKYFSYPIRCIIVTQGMDIPESMLESVKEHKVPIFRSKLKTTYFVHNAIDFLDSKLAPHDTIHGELLDIYGIGILLTGESGVGKSETALELIAKGHHLVADDVVDVRKVSENRIIGEPPEATRYFIEVRGIGIIDIRTMYGVGSVVDSKAIDMVINMETWQDGKNYNRLEEDMDFENILQVKIPKLTIPVRPGRNISIIIEVAARNFRLKGMGEGTSVELDKLING